MVHLIAKKLVLYSLISVVVFLPQSHAAPLSELWSNGEVNGTVTATGSVDVDGDTVHDIVCIKYASDPSDKTCSFKVVRGEVFTDLYDWVIPPGDISSFGIIADIDKNGTYEISINSITTISSNQYQAKIIIYNALTGAQIWESSAFSINSSMFPIYPLFSAFPNELVGTSDYEWMINLNEKDPSTEEESGKVMVYQKDAGSVGFSQLLWEQTYSGGMVYTYDTHYDLNRDGKPDLTVTFDPEEESSDKGAIICYQPSGLSSFTELVRFETTQPGNDLCMLYTESALQEMYPTRVDQGVTGGNLLFTEKWTESGQSKNIFYAYRADAPYSLIGTYTYDGKSVGMHPNDCDGDGWDELVLDYYDATSHTSQIGVYSAQGGNFTLHKI